MDAARKSFLITTGICSLISVGTTLTLIYFPVDSSVSFNNVSAVKNPLYLFYLCVYLLHPIVNISAALGVAYLKIREKPGWIALGFLFFLFWAYTEALQQSLSLVGNNLVWRTQYLAEQNENAKEVLQIHMEGFYGIYDSLYLLLLLGFSLGNLFYGIVFISGNSIERLIGGLYLLISFISLTGVLTYAQINVTFLDWSYPFIQPTLRILIGVWLLKNASAAVSVKESVSV